MIVGLIVFWLNPIIGVVFLISGPLLVGGVYLDMRRSAAKVRVSMPIPLHPKVHEVGLVEKLRARITLGPDGKYETDASPVEGELTLTLIFGRSDRERVERQLSKRFRALTSDRRFSAGRLVLQGRVGIKEGPDVPGPILALDGSTGSFPVFRTEDPHVSSTWKQKLSYRLYSDPDLSSGLVWITPSVVPESDRRALELEIQWGEIGSADEPLSLDVIELLQLSLPASWGNVEHVSERAIQRTLPDDPDGRQVVEWKQLSPGAQERDSGRLTLAVRFENRIDLDDAVQGRLNATMKGTLSGVDGIRLYGSLGKHRNTRHPNITTRVEVKFELSLASIRYQAIRIVPERGEEEISGCPSEFRVIPDDETIIGLTNAMSEQGYYIKRVIENPPRSGGRANHVQRFWDIAGRRYDGVYPIDFHVVLTGEEVHRGDIRPEEGTTKVRITVKGAYTNAEMYERVQQEWRALCALTADVLKSVESADSPAAPSLTAPGGEVGLQKALSRGAEPEVSSSQSRSELLRRLGKLDEALLDERISPEQYSEMRKRAELELGDT